MRKAYDFEASMHHVSSKKERGSVMCKAADADAKKGSWVGGNPGGGSLKFSP
jgi:hypothetical protein